MSKKLRWRGSILATCRKTRPQPISLPQSATKRARRPRFHRPLQSFCRECRDFLVVDKNSIDALNRVDEAITVATLPAYKPVVEGEMIATVKIIPFAVPGAARDQAVAAAVKAKPVIRIAPYKVRKVGIVSTLLPGLSPKVIDKTLKITATRIAPAGAKIIAEQRVPHERAGLARAIDELLKAGAELVIVFGASAIADRRDVIPAAVEAVGGEIEHFGMPVDPGNLMLIGTARGQAILGAPGCARSPKENGFDWVLMRLLAGLPVTRTDITGMGVGGLLMEIVTRPQPREERVPESGRRVAAVLLAAGRSTRMGAVNKMLAEIGGKSLVRIAAEQALASRAQPVIVVTGHQREKVEAALKGLPLRLVHNPNFSEGLGTSLKDRDRFRSAGGRRGNRLSRGYAAGRCGIDGSPDRCFRSRAWCARSCAEYRRTAREFRCVVTPFLSRPDVNSR